MNNLNDDSSLSNRKQKYSSRSRKAEEDIVTKNYGKVPWTRDELLQAHQLPLGHYNSLITRLCLLLDDEETTGTLCPVEEADDAMADLEETLYHLLEPRINAIVKKRQKVSEARSKAGRKGGQKTQSNAKFQNPKSSNCFNTKSDKQAIALNCVANDCESKSSEGEKCDAKTVSSPRAYTLCIHKEGGKGVPPYTSGFEKEYSTNRNGVLDSRRQVENSNGGDLGFNGDVKIIWGHDVPLDRTWDAWNNPTIDEMLSVIPVPPDRERWIAVSKAIYDFGATKDQWEKWCRKGQNFNKERNDAQWDSFARETPTNGSGRKITKNLLLKIWWHGLRVVRPVLGVSGASRGNGTKQQSSWSGRRSRSKREWKDPVVPASGHAVYPGKTITEMPGFIYGTEEEAARRAAIWTDEELDRRMVEIMAERGFPEWFVRSMGCVGVWHDATNRPAIMIPYKGEPDNYAAYRFMDIGPNEHDGRDRYCMSRGHARNYCQGFLLKEQLKDIFLVEGQMDAASLILANYPALAVKNINLIVEHEKAKPVEGRRFIIIMDNDEAGEKYAKDWGEVLKANSLPFSVEAMPADVKDVNEYLMKHGLDALKEHIAGLMNKDEKATEQKNA